MYVCETATFSHHLGVIKRAPCRLNIRPYGFPWLYVRSRYANLSFPRIFLAPGRETYIYAPSTLELPSRLSTTSAGSFAFFPWILLATEKLPSLVIMRTRIRADVRTTRSTDGIFSVFFFLSLRFITSFYIPKYPQLINTIVRFKLSRVINVKIYTHFLSALIMTFIWLVETNRNDDKNDDKIDTVPGNGDKINIIRDL